MNQQYRVIIPAAGRSSRSGLAYPKSLYRLAGIPILVRLHRQLALYDPKPVLVINPGHQTLFEEALREFGCEVQFVFQPEAKGMGQALLETAAATDDHCTLIMAWSDLPLLHTDTIRHMVDCHDVAENDFSLVTARCESCYTIVQRDQGKIKAVIETRAAGIPPGKDGERDIGLFVFRKKPVFDLLNQFPEWTEVNGKKEQGFLYIIAKLAEAGYKVEGYPLAKEQDLLSFNTPEELMAIEQSPYLTTDR